MKIQTSCKQTFRKFTRNLIAILFLLFSLIACATFQSTQKYDISPFANSIIAVAGDIQYSLLQYNLIAVRKLAKGPEVEKFVQHKEKLKNLIRGIIAYSIEIVTLGESNLSEPEKSQALANYLENLKRPALEKPIPALNITLAQFDTIIANVRSQKKFLDALGAAQPLVDEVARISRILTEDTKSYLDTAGQVVRKEWDKEYEAALWARDFIKSAQMNAITSLYYGTMVVQGNENYLDSVYKYDPLTKKMFPEGHKFSREDILKVEDRLIYKLETIRNLKELFHEDIVEYEEGLLELDEARQVFNEALRKAGLAILMWSRAHLQLSRGVTEPAEIDIMNLMLGVGQKFVPGL